MALRLAQVNVKARNAPSLARYWAQALGWSVFTESPGSAALGPESFTWPDPAAICIDVIEVPDPSTVRDRVHLDLATTSVTHQAELVARLTDLGATPADVGQGDVPWTVLADPDGNVFCVLEPRDIYRDTGPIAAIVVDCADPRAMARFWDAALDWTLLTATDDFAQFRASGETGPFLEFIRRPAPLTMRNHMHLDLLPGDQAAEVARLQTLGATEVRPGAFPWQVMTDPEGNEFCVLAPH